MLRSPHPTTRLVVPLSTAVAVLLVVLSIANVPSGQPPFGALYERLYHAGTRLTEPGLHVVNFAVPSHGAVLIGSVAWDHTSASLELSPPAILCARHGNFSGPSWTETFDTPLSPGTYSLSDACFGSGNGTVTDSLEIVEVF